MPFTVPVYFRAAGITNGNLPPSELAVCGTPPWKLWVPAARCHRAMMHYARQAGFDPRSTGTLRTYERQVALFLERMAPGYDKDRISKFWDGRWWHLRPGMAEAATPGTSEHGWGCADDVAEELDGDIPAESISQSFYLWLVFNARYYGFEQTNSRERWHWAYVLGGVIPPHVLLYENPNPPEWMMADYLALLTDGRLVEKTGGVVREVSRQEFQPGAPLAGEPVWTVPADNDTAGYANYWLGTAADHYKRTIKPT